MNAETKIGAAPNVYAKIAAVQGQLARDGIGKNSKNTFDKYMFRGIDAVYNALAPLLAQNGLCVLPRIIERDLQERTSRKGDPMFYVTVTAEFDFVSADDGSTHTVRTYGEAMDRSDKATNKAMSAAYKYAAFMTFAIPTEGDNDADASTPEVATREGQSQGDDQGTVNPPAPRRGWREPKSSLSTPSKLSAEMHRLERELAGCGDSGMVYALTMTDEWKEFVRVSEKHAPHYLRGGAPAPEEFEGLQNTAERMVREFDGADANERVGMVQAG